MLSLNSLVPKSLLDLKMVEKKELLFSGFCILKSPMNFNLNTFPSDRIHRPLEGKENFPFLIKTLIVNK